MSELGRLLSEARTQRELTLAEVEAGTRIRQKYIEALETGNFAALPRGATGRGFLRIYARYLGLDLDTSLRQYVEESGDKGLALPLASEGREVDYRPLEVELLNETGGTHWWPWAMAVVIVVAAVGVGGWGLLGGRFGLKVPDWQFLTALGPQATATVTPTTSPSATATGLVVRMTPTPPVAPAAAPTTQAQPSSQPLPTSDLLPFPTPTVPPTVTATPRPPTATPEVVARISIQIRISQRAWVRAVADGKVLEETLMEPGQTRDWEANNTLALRSGNAAGVELTVNGQNLGSMGAVGQVIERSWVVEQGKIVEMTPVAGQVVAPTATAAK